ncbi:ATP-dependent DNA helicase sgs1 [Rhodosporidiobolus nylandii]
MEKMQKKEKEKEKKEKKLAEKAAKEEVPFELPERLLALSSCRLALTKELLETAEMGDELRSMGNARIRLSSHLARPAKFDVVHLAGKNEGESRVLLSNIDQRLSESRADFLAAGLAYSPLQIAMETQARLTEELAEVVRAGKGPRAAMGMTRSS